MTPQQLLRERLNDDTILVAPGVYDALSANLAALAGFAALYVSGASIAYTRLARPDLGYLGADQVAEIVRNIGERTELPLIVDADTGFGNALNVQRTLQILEQAGASAIQLEDQSIPKRCGHLDGKILVSAAEMVGKIHAAVDARRDEATLIVARTDAVGPEGFEAALERAAAYAEAGADLLFVEALRDEEQMRRAVAMLGDVSPLMANMVEGGKTPLLGARELQAIGFSLVIFPGALVRALSRTAQEFFSSLYTHGTTKPFQDRMLDFNGLNDVLGTPDILAAGKRYDPDTST
ncbi:MAG: isocitrate lyase/phosphoenolpyruvate mutase family protein [Gammaproteobacteria bacterium]|nr:isocitrate lyase/phosphoenolpyruvate mutase family protein [Gammaproteobacteria bacterium]